MFTRKKNNFVPFSSFHGKVVAKKCHQHEVRIQIS